MPQKNFLHGELFVIAEANGAISFTRNKPHSSASTVTQSLKEHLPQTRHPTSSLVLMHSCLPSSSENLPLVTTLSSCSRKQLTQAHRCPPPALCALVQHQLFLSCSCQRFQLGPCQANRILMPLALFFPPGCITWKLSSSRAVIE